MGSKAHEKAESVFKQYYDTHTNSLGDTWYSCNRCEESYRTEFNSTMRDHVNSKHLKIALKCTHCTFQTYRAKELNTHRRTYHQITALRCCVELCPFKTILAEKLVDHLEKKHQCRPEDAQATAQNIIACQQPSGPPTTRAIGMAAAYSSVKEDWKNQRVMKEEPSEQSSTPLSPRKRAKYYFLPTTKPGKRPRMKNPKSDDCKLFKPVVTQDGVLVTYKCSFCDYTGHDSTMSSHINSAHQDRIMKCPECDFVTFYQKNLATHAKKRHAVANRRCIVPECGYVCLNDDSMQIHVMSKHANLYDDKKHAIVVYTAAPAPAANTNPGFN